MPTKPPTIIDKIDMVVDFITGTCQVPWIVYVETLDDPAQTLFLGMVDTSMTDIIRSFARPKGLRSGRHGRKGRGGKHRGIPDIAELIGGTVGDVTEVKGRVYSAGVKTLWIVDTALQRVFFWWFVAELVTDVAYSWVSAIMADPRTQCDLEARMLRTGGDAIIAVHGPPIIYGIPKLEWLNGDITTNRIGAIVGDLRFDVMMACTVHWAGIFPSDIMTGRIILRDGTKWVAAQESGFLFYGGSQDLVIHAVVSGPANITWVIDTPLFSGVTFKEGTVSIISRAKE